MEGDEPRAGGALIALAVLAGAGIGAWRHQPTIGILVGAGVGIVATLLLWAKDRRRG